MKYGLIKKSAICVLSLSCLATLASCSFGGSSVKVFANKDIQAYAKKNDITNEIGNIELKNIDLNEYDIVENKFSYSLVQNKTTDKYQLYMRYANKVYDIPTEEGEYIPYDGITALTDLENSYGYFCISFSTGKKMVIDYKGDALMEKGEYVNINFAGGTDRIIDYEALYTGEKKFYDVFTVETSEETKKRIFEVIATFNKGSITDFTRKEISDLNEIDYSQINMNNTITANLKKYDFYKTADAFYVKDLKGKLVSNISLSTTSTYYVLDDKLFYQTSKTVTIDDNYTYYDGTAFYQLETYSVDLASGKQTKIKNYNYKISSTTNIYGYDEKENRIYVAAIYATLRKIDDKKLSAETTTAMLDKNGKFLSNKIGEKGTSLKYFDDKTYVLYEGTLTSIISNTGKVKGTYDTTTNSIGINFSNKQIFIIDSNDEGYFVDSDLKILTDPKAFKYAVLHTFKNGNMLIGQYSYSVYNGSGYETRYVDKFLAKIENGEITKMDNFDEIEDDYSGDITDYITDNARIFITSDSLNFSNLYLVLIEKDNKYTVEIHSANGNTLDKIEDVTDLTLNQGTQFVISIETSDGKEIVYAANYINTKTTNTYN